MKINIRVALVSLSIVTLATLVPVASRAATHVHSARPHASATSGNFGLGLMLGDPSGLTAKYWLSNINAVDFGLSYSFNDYVALFSDYLWHFPHAFAGAGRHGNEFVPYLGIGALLFFDNGDYFNHHSIHNDTAALGARIPFGVEFLPPSLPLGFFAEIVPGVGLIPSVFGFVQGDVGARFYF